MNGCLSPHSCHLVKEGCTLKASCPSGRALALSQSGSRELTSYSENLKDMKLFFGILSGSLRKVHTRHRRQICGFYIGLFLVRKKACTKKSMHSRPLPGVMGLKTVDCLGCTKSGSGRTRSMISWSLGLGGLAWTEDRMAAGWGIDVTSPSTSWSSELLPTVGSTCRVL